MGSVTHIPNRLMPQTIDDPQDANRLVGRSPLAGRRELLDTDAERELLESTNHPLPVLQCVVVPPIIEPPLVVRDQLEQLLRQTIPPLARRLLNPEVDLDIGGDERKCDSSRVDLPHTLHGPL